MGVRSQIEKPVDRGHLLGLRKNQFGAAGHTH